MSVIKWEENKMNKKSGIHILIILIVVSMFMLIACSNDGKKIGSENKTSDNNKSAQPDPDADGIYNIEDFNNTKTNQGDAIDGGDLTVALVTSSAFEGTLNHLYQTVTTDDTIMGWFTESILEMDENFEYTQDGPATYELDEENRVWTITIRDNVNWHDGEPVIAEDLELAYNILGHPDYDGPWYGDNQRNVEGMEEYRAGEKDSISGIEVLDDKTIEITFIEPNPFVLIWSNPVPKHIFGDMELSEIASSPEVREHPIGYGPFIVDRIVPGESVVFKKNEDYWRGEVALDEVTLKVVDSSTVVQELKSGGVDIAGFPSAQYPENADMTNVEFLAEVGNTVTYIGFRLGTQDEESGESIPDPDMKMADVELRKAMWHAVDNEIIANQYYHGLQRPASTLISPYHREFHDETNSGLEYDPDKANEILDAAGYEWVEGEKYRTDPDGNDLEITLAAYEGGDTAEPIAKYYLQAWENVGINVELLDGRLQELNNYYEMLKATSGDRFDMYLAQLGLGSSPDPAVFKGPYSIYNYARWQSEEGNELLEAGRSEKAFDREWLKETYNDWQQLMVEQVPEFPTLYSTSMTAVNERVLNYSIDPAEKMYLYEISVSQDEPIIDGQ